jgi:hypothetical protein
VQSFGYIQLRVVGSGLFMGGRRARKAIEAEKDTELSHLLENI